MIADGLAPLACKVDDVFEGADGFLLRGLGIRDHPIVHFSDVPRVMISVQKLGPVLSAPLRHQSRLVVNRSPATGDADTRVGKLFLHLYDERLHVGWALLRSSLTTTLRLRLRRMMSAMRMSPMMVRVPGIDGFR
jgi:hypothetical protein